MSETESKYQKAKLHMIVIGKKGYGKCVAFGPTIVAYDIHDERGNKVDMLTESWEDVFLPHMDRTQAASFIYGSKRDKE